MNKFMLISLFFMMLTGCAALDASVGSNPFDEQPAQAMPALPTQAATITPSRTASPTRIDYGPLPITETAVALEGIAISQERAWLQARETTQALDRAQAEQTATWAAPTETAQARGTMTAVAWVVAKD